MLRYYKVQINISLFCLQTGPGEARGSVHPVVGPSLQPEAPEEQQPLSQQPPPQSCQLRWLYTFRCVTQQHRVVLHYVAGRPVVFHSAPLLSYVVSSLPEQSQSCLHRPESRAQEGRRGPVGVRERLLVREDEEERRASFLCVPFELKLFNALAHSYSHCKRKLFFTAEK